MSAFTSSAGGQFASVLGLAMAAANATGGASSAELAAQVKKLAAGYKDLLETYERSIGIWESAVAGAKEVIAQRDAAIGRLNASIGQANADAARFVNEIASLKRDLSQAKREREDSDRKFSLLARRYGDLEKENARLKAVSAVSGAAGAGADAQAAAKARAEGFLKELDELRRWHAANLALRCALEVQLLRSDPENPLLQDQDLRERVRRAGEMAAAILGGDPSPLMPDPFDMAREAGLTFSVPGRASGADVTGELALADVYVKRLIKLNLPADRALEVLARVQRGEGALTAARELLREYEPDSNLLSAETVQRVQSIAAEEFQKQQRERRAQRGGPSAAWHATILGQQQVRQRVSEELGVVEGEEADHA